MRAQIADGEVVAIVTGNVPGVEIPEAFLGLAQSDPARLIWTGERIDDAASIEVWFISPAGERRAYRPGSEWQRVTGQWNARAIKDGAGNWSLESAADARKAALYAHAASRRWRFETGGVTVAGMSVPTDERTQAVLTAAFARAKADAAYSIPRWKTAPGQYTALTNAQIVAIAKAVAAHIQRAFDLNAEVDDKIGAGDITSEAQINAIFAAA